MTAVQQHETPEIHEDHPEEVSEALNGYDLSKKKHKKKNKEERRKRSRSCSTASSCSTSSKRKRKKKKHHRRSLDEPPSPKVNPIFLWVKEDNAKIVEVRCEDYDRRNRIKLTKTAGGWRAIPHVAIQWQTPELLKVPKTEALPPKIEPESCDSHVTSCNRLVKIELKSPVPIRGETPPPKLEMCKTESDVPLCEAECREMPPLEPQNVSPRQSVNPCQSTNPYVAEHIESPVIVIDDDEPKLIHFESKDQPEVGIDQIPPKSPAIDDEPPKPVIDDQPSIDEKIEPEQVEKPECAVKCCDEIQSNNVDENHNNEFDGDPRSSCMIEPSNFCQDVEEILGAIENSERRDNSERRPEQSKDVDEYDHSALMTELEEMMNERMKHENAAHKDVLDDIYTFVPSPSHEKSQEKKVKETRPTSKIERVIEAVKAKSACAMLAKNAGEERTKDVPPSQLKTCELETLDLLWRLPEGTTIHHSKLNDEKEPESVNIQQQNAPESTTATITMVKPAPPIVTAPAAVPKLVPSQPVQDEPLNLGKPRKTSSPAPPPLLKKETPPCKVESKPHLAHVDSDPSQPKVAKTSEKFPPDGSKSAEPLAQLKEIMSDPDVTVPDPLLVPKERLSALIANPKREIPRLMALTNEVKYPKLDTNLMEVSLAHLQLLLQSSKKEDELKLIQKHADLLQSHLKNDSSSLDPATMNALNQMLWFPYISHLDMSRNSNPQDLMGMMNMMYPYNAWGQQSYDYAQQSHLMNFWQDMAQKPMAGGAGVTKGYADLYKPMVPPSLYTSAPTVGAPMHQTSSYHSRPTKRRHRSGGAAQATPDFLKTTPDFLKTTPDFLKTAPDFLKSPFDVSWALPQTSEAGRVRAPSRSESRPEPAAPPIPGSVAPSSGLGALPSPKLKVRKFDVDPNAVPKLINKNLTAPPLPPLTAMSRQVPSHYYDSNHLWNPLYAATEAREPDYTTTGHWNWTTPVTVSGK